ncbi:LysR family transcriptional regulator [Terasakiella sp. A23]|uniref:LysR family transcriptional regulator n=1 Tax=Terasakiella sp. FCG-A23 TaxID=3080561 RepID=UPI002953DE65|nr:LysR family transcriptional regulator [Terasakiella sp. A23]MDV7340218.1 LysR family transcriptional regulator [Terasakiella sp. A23]
MEFVLAVAKEGSAAGAARMLGVNHATVIRRIQNFESQWDEPIFEHRREGYRLTEAGSVFLDAAQSIDEILEDLKRKATGGQQNLSGHVRITTTDSLFPILVEEVPVLRKAYPDITLDISMTNKRLDLFNRDADIALRPSQQPPQDLIGRRVGKLEFGIYTALSVTQNQDLKELPWLGLDEPLASSSFGRYFSSLIGDFNIVARADSFVSLKTLAEAKVGSVFLPRYLGDDSDILTRVYDDFVEYDVDLWLLTHPDIVRAQRVRVCMDHLYKALKRHSWGGKEGT